MAEHKTTQQAVREQYKVAETMAEQMLRAWADLATTTTEYTFEGFEKTLRYGQETRLQAEKLTHEALTGYKRIYEDGLKTWQSYLQGVNEIMTRATQN
ncbi:MAG: hypothetical protein U0Z44_11285 [Kouleothrix sp.]|jgi:hypothetical protein|nr:hypothetical protein [Kouleothrix sp.]